jgi:hypothetical protein
MNPKTLRLFAAGIAIAAALLCWYLLGIRPEGAARRTGKVPLSGPQGSPHKPPSSNGQPPEPWEALHVAKLGSASVERARKWLDGRGRDAAGLIALWELTGDEALLTEAAKNFPDDPRVCRAMISHTRADAKAALPWIERLIAADPKSPDGFYLKSWALMTGGDRQEALSVLKKAGTMCGIAEDHGRESFQLIGEAARASGAGNRDAMLLALHASRQHSLTQTAVDGMNAAVRAELAEAKAAGSEDRLLAVAGLGFTAASNLTTLPGMSMKNEIDATSLEIEIFAELPGDAEFGEGGRTTAALKSGTENRRRYLEKTLAAATAAGDFLLQAGEDSVNTYASCFMSHGEQAATSFALSTLPHDEASGTAPP